MSFGLSSRQICLRAAVLTLSGLLAGSARADDKEGGRPIEFSVPRSGDVTTNLQQLTNKKDSLKQLEEDLSKPLPSLDSESSFDSLEGVVVRPPRRQTGPAIQNKRVKELLERRKDWIFMSPEDLLAAPTVEEILKTPQLAPDGREKEELPAMERYYRRQATKRSEVNNPMQYETGDLLGPPSKSKPREEQSVQEDSDLPAGLRKSAEVLNKLFESGASDSTFTQDRLHGTLSDMFGLDANPQSKEQIQEHKKFMDEYRAILDPSWRPPSVASPGDPFPTLPDTTSLTPSPAAGLSSSPGPAPRTTFDVPMDVFSPKLGPPGLPDVGAQALGQMKPPAAFPTVQSITVVPPTPSFTAPKRSF